jgi:hypothetical protein
MARKRRPSASGLTAVVGGMLVGFDEQVLRSLPRAELLVERGKAIRGLSAQGGTLLVGLPDDLVVLPERALAERALAERAPDPEPGPHPVRPPARAG